MSGSQKVFIVAGKRTPFGKFGGPFKEISPVDLAVHCSKAIFDELKVLPEDIDQVILGNVVPSSTDAMYGGRHLALKLGCKEQTPGYVVNRLCGSGLQAISDAKKLILLGEASCVLASGTENMSMVPHLTYGGRFGTKYGPLKNVDMLLDALTDKYIETPMGNTAENLAERYDLSREECDRFAQNSHLKAQKSYEQQKIQGEIASLEIRGKVYDKDGHLRENISLEEMAGLSPSFKKNGVVTPASASGIVDGAASVLLASEEFCRKKNLTPLAEIIDDVVVGVDPKIMGIGPVDAISLILKRNKLDQSEIDLFEINEAFAAQILACMKEMNLDDKRVNLWGGAIALGHPLAATGTRIALTLTRLLIDQKKNLGIASACIGGGQGIALLLKRANTGK